MRYSETQQAYITINGASLCTFCQHDKYYTCDKGIEFDRFGINRGSTRMCKLATPKEGIIVHGLDVGTGSDRTAVTAIKNGEIIQEESEVGWGKSPIEKCLPDILKLDKLQKENT